MANLELRVPYVNFRQKQELSDEEKKLAQENIGVKPVEPVEPGTAIYHEEDFGPSDEQFNWATNVWQGGVYGLPVRVETNTNFWRGSFLQAQVTEYRGLDLFFMYPTDNYPERYIPKYLGCEGIEFVREFDEKWLNLQCHHWVFKYEKDKEPIDFHVRWSYENTIDGCEIKDEYEVYGLEFEGKPSFKMVGKTKRWDWQYVMKKKAYCSKEGIWRFE